MGDTVKNTTSADKTPKPSFVKGLKSEFKKIIWPDKKTLGKQAVAVVAISVVLGIVITLLDGVMQLGVNFLVK